MTRQMTAYQQPRMPAPMGRDLSNTIAKFTNRLEAIPGPYRKFSITAQMAPTAAERNALQARRNELMDALAPGDEEGIRQAIRALKGGFPNYGVDAVGAKFQIEFYLKALDSFPLWAVLEACARFRDGRNETPWKPSECPSSAQLAQECRAIISPVSDEIRPLADVLDAEVVPEADPDAVRRAALLTRWQDEIRPTMKDQGKPKESREDAEKKLSELYQKRSEPVAIGDGLAKILGSMKKDQAA